MLARTLIFTLFITLAACSKLDSHCANLPSGGHYCLQPTFSIAPFDAQQKVETTFNGRQEAMIVEIESDAKGLRFVGLTPFGHKLIQVSYDNHTVVAITMPSQHLDPTLFIALLQLSLWPSEAVRAGLSVGLTLKETNNGRYIVSGDDTILTVSHTADQLPYHQLHLTIPSLGLEFDVENMSAATPINIDQ